MFRAKNPKKSISKRKKIRFMCRENLDEYLKDSTLHGLRYLGDRTLTIFERYITFHISEAISTIRIIISKQIFVLDFSLL